MFRCGAAEANERVEVTPMARKAKTRTKKRPVKKKKAARKKAAVKRKSARRKAKKLRMDRRLDEGLMETFPGSDPVAVTDPTFIDKRN
jgi:hypothetical protein